MARNWKHRSTEHVFSRNILYVLVFLYFLLFFSAVIFGWYEFLKNAMAGFDFAYHAFVIFIVVFLVWVFSRHAGKGIFYWWGGERNVLSLPLMSMLLLFGVSAIGVINAYLRFVEAPQIMRQEIDDSLNAVADFRTRATATLRDPEIEQLEAFVRMKKAALVSEINNANGGRWCGVGPGALAILAEVRRVLPDVVELRGSKKQHDCSAVDDLRRIATAYENLIDQALQSHPSYLSSNIAMKRSVIGRIDSETRDLEGGLKDKAAEIGGYSDFYDNYQVYLGALSFLRDVEGRYSALYRQVRSLTGEEVAGAPQTLKFERTRQLSNLGSVFQSLVTQLWLGTNRWRLVLFSIIALAFDSATAVGMALAFDAGYRRSLRRRSPSCFRIGGADVNCLLPALDFVVGDPSARAAEE